MSVIRTITPIILASSSAIRQHMLKSVGLTFQVTPSGFDETGLKETLQGASPSVQALALARAKALSVSMHYPDAITIGADQICEMDGTVFNKPGSYEAAQAQLKQMSGKSHTQTSGLVFTKGTEVLFEYSETATLTLRTLDEASIKAYVAADAPLHSCGAYKFESLGRHLFAKIEGDHDVIKGLPLTRLLAELHRLEAIGF